ncbi:hypothetical protein BST28156_06152 [Burkholderia stagnalis]|nr:hypothetical protein BST28156_06152 [Burkholderia stagnalis]
MPGQRCGTSWNVAPLPSPNATYRQISSAMPPVTGGIHAANAKSAAAIAASSTISARTPVTRSARWPPNGRTIAPRKASSDMSRPASIFGI